MLPLRCGSVVIFASIISQGTVFVEGYVKGWWCSALAYCAPPLPILSTIRYLFISVIPNLLKVLGSVNITYFLENALFRYPDWLLMLSIQDSKGA